jgi:hypothetical protein
MNIIVGDRIDWFVWKGDKEVKGHNGHHKPTEKS